MDDADGFSEPTVRRMVREIRPEWTIREATAADEGTDAVYFVTADTPDGPRECVLKACEFLDPEEFRPEPHLMALLERRTSIPVPGVVGAVDSAASPTPRSDGGETAGANRDDLPAPFFLMERCDGEVCEGDARDLPLEAIERIARDAGRNLGELHELGDFEAFGPVRLARDADRDRGGIAVDDGHTLTTAETATDSWRARVENLTEFFFDNLDDRFADLEADVRALTDARLDALDREFAPVFGHDDYRLGNLLVDPETGETKTVLDRGNANTLEAHYNLVLTEQYLSGWAPHDDSRRERVRAALREGYAETNRLEEDAAFERRREPYLGATRLFPMACFSLWYDDASDAEQDGAAEEHRRAVRDLT